MGYIWICGSICVSGRNVFVVIEGVLEDLWFFFYIWSVFEGYYVGVFYVVVVFVCVWVCKVCGKDFVVEVWWIVCVLLFVWDLVCGVVLFDLFVFGRFGEVVWVG